jgi:polyphosphate kinase
MSQLPQGNEGESSAMASSYPTQITLADEPERVNPALYLDRELSWIAFNQRVLEEAQDASNPLLEREIAHQLQSGDGRLIFKCNALTDEQMILALYRASQAGVQVDLIVRSMCSLRPGVPGVSETIRVRSIVGRFLEHSRIYYFANGGAEEIYLGSADLMDRNLDRRVEVLFPIEDARLKRYLQDTILAVNLMDNTQARTLQRDGTYRRETPGDDDPISAQQYFLDHPLP